MDSAALTARLHDTLTAFAPEQHRKERGLSLYSAAIALAEPATMARAIETCRTNGVTRSELYEIILQSYLFLGFPRMLIAADCLNDTWPEDTPDSPTPEFSADQAQTWFDRGTELCKEVYGSNYQRLKNRVLGMAPDIFHWMVFEGYGKVLSRPGLDVIARELAIVACLMIENRPAQLFSHMKGALNVGTSIELLEQVVTDIGEAAGPGLKTARGILMRLRSE